MEARRVIVAIADPALARVLVMWLRDALVGHQVVGAEARPQPGDVVLATPADCDAVAAAELVDRGIQPIILSPIPRRDEVARYAGAGAVYLVMSIDNRSLENAVRTAMDGQFPSPAPVIAPRAVASHAVSPRCA